MKKLTYRANGIDNVVEVPSDATDARIIDLPEIGDMVRITKMGLGLNDRPEYIGKVGKVKAVHGKAWCLIDEILVEGCDYYVKGWEVLERKEEIL